jgi:hypothetical protein
MNIYTKVISSILRALFMLLAGFLTQAGVPDSEQKELVETTVNVVAPIVISAVVVYWSYIEKRFIPKLLELAFHANPAVETFEDLIRKAKEQ